MLVLYIAALTWVCRGQVTEAYGYAFTTGVDENMWIDIEEHQTVLVFEEAKVPLPFAFTFHNRTFTSLSVTRNGAVIFGNEQPLGGTDKLVIPCGNGFDLSGVWGLCFYDVRFFSGCTEPDSAGNRVFVLQFRPAPAWWYTSSELIWWQVQLHEGDGKVVLAYKIERRNNAGRKWIGVQMHYHEYLYVSPRTHAAYDTVMDETSYNDWPEIGRYYCFTPVDTFCPPPALKGVESRWTSPDSAKLVWRGCSRYSMYTVEYDTAGFAEGTGIALTTADTQVVLTGLAQGVDYEARVYGSCTDSQLSAPAQVLFRAPCSSEMLTGTTAEGLAFYDLTSEGVICYTGSTVNPSERRELADFGSLSPMSRHTVHCDALERDPRTDGCLRTVPEGHCVSVRLGNWRNGAEQEAISYTLHVDTNQYDLLLLRYALVEQDPKHPLANQPQFEFDITDSVGNSLGDCYHGMFVSGTGDMQDEEQSGWRRGQYDVLWRDWDVVGVDLAPMHGQTICVTLSNRDCAQQGHFGYGYFALEGGRKHFRYTACGEVQEYVVRAPEGFSYRWYSDADTSVTLSSTDSLRFPVPGLVMNDGSELHCRVSHRLSGHECSFVMTTYVGGRYPVADFGYDVPDPCDDAVRFHNYSVVARDSAHSMLTLFPCERYRWVFDNETVVEDEHPVYHFGTPGWHVATLYAMLADGDCVDSVSDTLFIDIPADTLYDTICEGEVYHFDGRDLVQAGVYSRLDSCRFTMLMLHVHPRVYVDVVDTMELGDTYRFAGRPFWGPAVYRVRYSTLVGCDSVVTLHLSSREEQYQTVCESALPFTLQDVMFDGPGCDTVRFVSHTGTDSLVVLHLSVRPQVEYAFQAQPHCRGWVGYAVPLVDTLCYRFVSSPADSMLSRQLLQRDTLRLAPASPTLYVLTADWCDAPSCPVADTLWLLPVEDVEARMMVEPGYLTEHQLEFTATDLSLSGGRTAAGDKWRQWTVGVAPQASNGEPPLVINDDSVIHCNAAHLGIVTPDAGGGQTVVADSLVVMLTVGNDQCSDTAVTIVPIRVDRLWFPNVFTPGEATNNLFRGYGVNIRDYDLQVYTRWGDCIFRTKDINQGWDGTYRGVQSPMSAYAYICHYTTLEGEPRVVTGTVTLLR